MIWSSRLAKIAVVLLATGAHATAAVLLLSNETAVEQAGGEGVEVQARLGNSFADLAMGTMSAAEPLEVVMEPTVTAIEAMEPTHAVQPETAEALQPVPLTALAPTTTTTLTQVQTLTPTTPVATPVTVQTLAPASVTQSLSALPDDGVVFSPRPPERPQAIERAAADRKVAARTQRAQRAAPRGNAAQSATAGRADGAAQARSPQASTGKKPAPAAGNAAADNYPGEVMRRISRVPRPRAGSRGTAVVSFSISGNGGLSALGLVRSSGSDRLDDAALNIIRSAAPFPRPPAGARRSYQISIQGR